MAAKGWAHADVMRITGASSSLVSQWRGKGSKPIKEITNVAAAIKLEAASGYCAQWIADGTGPKHPPAAPASHATAAIPSRLALALAEKLDQISDPDTFAAAYVAAVDAICATLAKRKAQSAGPSVPPGEPAGG